MYYLQSRYYDPEVCRFLNADEYASTGYDFAGYNMFAYCNNNPVIFCDDTGRVIETIFDIVTLGFSIAEVIDNPSDPWAWVGLACDLIDLIPCVTGVGELVRGVKAVSATAKVVDDVIDSARIIEKGSEVASATSKGWKLGDDIRKLTKAGNAPSWTTVRNRYWKNEALYNSSMYSSDDLIRMRKGLAPIGDDGFSMELHHTFGRSGEYFYVFEAITRTEHQFIHGMRF